MLECVPQLLSTGILTLLRSRLPDDAFAIIAITMTDLYPDESWNFVFGQASLADRVGVYSFARYDPGFFGQLRVDDWRELMLLRSCGVLAHETGHMFGMQHCIYFSCVMNGSNNQAESDAQPLDLCPVCLRKLQHSVGFNVVERYRALHEFCEQAELDVPADWYATRLQRLAPAAAPQKR